MTQLHVATRTWTVADAGILIAGHHGWHAHYMMIDLAIESGWSAWKDEGGEGALAAYRDGSVDSEVSSIIFEMMDDAEDWMNEHVAPEGYSFGWHDGEFFLGSDAWWDES